MRDDLGYFDDETGDGDRRIGVSQEHNSSKRVRPFLHDVLCERRSVVVNQHAPRAHPITRRFCRRGDARVAGLAARALGNSVNDLFDRQSAPDLDKKHARCIHD